MRRDENGSLVFSVKRRPIKFASHRDAAVLEYYARDLLEAYERFLAKTAFAQSVLAYRSGIGNNIGHSKSLFDEIRLRGDCTAIALDITSFFDRIRHDQLYEELCRVRGRSRLSDVDFKIFRRMTKFDWVDSEEAKDRLGYRFGRNRRVCTAYELRTILRDQAPNQIRTNTGDFGIPQGTPLSGLYANISLAGFDAAMTSAVQNLGGSYRRYSDDIALLIPTSEEPALAVDAVRDTLRTFGLELSEGKTDVAVFNRAHGELRATKPFQYLGFTFDGTRTLIRPSSLNRYYSKMNRGIRAKVHAAYRKDVLKDQMFLRELFKKYTHFGRFRNFPRYVYRSAAIHNAPEMRKQINRHMTIFKRMLTRAVGDIY